MKKYIKEKIILITSILILLICGISIYFTIKKYNDVDIMSLKREYNLVFNSKDETLKVPLYLGRRNTFLSNYNQIDNVTISNDYVTLNSYLESIQIGNTISYDNQKYYEYIYYLSFKNIESSSTPIYIYDGLLNISFVNGDKLSFKIGNLSLMFNSSSDNENYLYLYKLNALFNTVEGIDTIVGINITLKNNSNSVANIKSFMINNDLYELDYNNLVYEQVDSETLLTDKYFNYKYKVNFIDNNDLNLMIDPYETVDLFIPLKYLSDIKIVDRLPLYINYTINDKSYTFIQDDFLFAQSNAINEKEVFKIVYKFK